MHKIVRWKQYWCLVRYYLHLASPCGFLADSMALGHISLEYSSFPVSVMLPVVHSKIYLSTVVNNWCYIVWT